MYSVIMAGGSGTRFWPASRKHRPKQLLTLGGGRSLLQQTVDRLSPLTGPGQVLVVTGAGHAAGVAQQLPQLPAGQILAEPQARNTAAAVGLAATWVARRHPAAVCLVLPADHLITDEALFIDTLRRAAAVAQEQEVLVTLGLTPRYPATGFGYIETGKVEIQDPPRVSRVNAFHEKPDPATAQRFLDSGRHLWNSGMFAWRAEVILAEIERHLPELAAGLKELAPFLGTEKEAQALAEVYPRLPSISVDYAILEKSDQIRVVQADFGWSDVGSWEAMTEIWECDPEGNACQKGRVVSIEAADNVVAAGDRLVALLGVKGLVAVVTDDVLMIVPKERAQDVKLLREALRKLGHHEYL